MKLSYRGANYEAKMPHLETDADESIGVYRGAPLKRKHFKQLPHGHNRVEFTYRGVHYSHDV